MRRLLIGVALVALVAAGGYWRFGSHPDANPPPAAAAKPAGRSAVPVVMKPAARQAVPERFSTVGSAQPLATVAVRARVDSVVDAVHFTEGQEVRRGDLLFTLDDRSLKAQLRLAEANLERDTAQWDKAKGDVARYSELLKRAAVARQQYDAAVAAADGLEATVKADQAAIDSARIALGYTRIFSPMDGRTGTVAVKPGSSVRAADATPLVSLTQLRPIQVAFYIPERHLSGVREAMAGGTLAVTARAPGDTRPPAEGALTFIDSQVDQQTGTVLAKGTFANADTRLWPGQFVDVVLTLRIDADALTVPSAAVQTGQQGPFAYVVTPDKTVEMRPLSVTRYADGLAVIAKGLNEGETVVTDGQSRLFPGAPVTSRDAAQDKGAGDKGAGDKGAGPGAAAAPAKGGVS